LWIVPAILPLLPAPATLLRLLAETEAAQQALQGQALTIAFAIGAMTALGGSAQMTRVGKAYKHVVFERCAQNSRSVMRFDTIAACSTGSSAYRHVTNLSTNRAISAGG
jgi:hypothetical protein